jgi:hypothetical protein
MPQYLSSLVSSPADVPNERLRADLIAGKLAQDRGCQNNSQKLQTIISARCKQ